jgi:hypothetical protein
LEAEQSDSETLFFFRGTALRTITRKEAIVTDVFVSILARPYIQHSTLTSPSDDALSAGGYMSNSESCDTVWSPETHHGESFRDTER